MLSVKGMTWGTPEFIKIAKLGEYLYEQEHNKELTDGGAIH